QRQRAGVARRYFQGRYPPQGNAGQRLSARPPTPRLALMIKFIRNRIPSFKTPSYRGQRYEALVPDTLDIQERAALAINGLTGPTDPKENHRLYFSVNFSGHPPSMTHTASDICQTKFMEAL